MKVMVRLLCVLSIVGMFISAGFASEIVLNDVQKECRSFIYELRTSQNDTMTAFAVHPSGIFMTCAHILEKKQSSDFEIVLLSHEKEIIPVKILLVVEQLDVMLLVTEKKGNYPSVSWDLSETYPLGASFYTCGNNKGEMSSSFGFLLEIQSKMKSCAFSDVMLLNLPVVPGYSGAPLFNKDGQVSGMILGNNNENPAISYAISANYLIKECMKIVNSSTLYGMEPHFQAVLDEKALMAIGEWNTSDEVQVWLSSLAWAKNFSKQSMNVTGKNNTDGQLCQMTVPILENYLRPLSVSEMKLQLGAQIVIRDSKTGNVLLNGNIRTLNGVCFFPNSSFTIRGFLKIPAEGSYSFFLPQAGKGELKINDEIFIQKTADWQINTRKYGYFHEGFYSFELNLSLLEIPQGPCLGVGGLGTRISAVIPDAWLYSIVP